MAQILKNIRFHKLLPGSILKSNASVETPPFILITTVTLIGVIASLIAAVIVIILYFAEYFSHGDFVNDALLMKNLIYFFGHTI